MTSYSWKTAVKVLAIALSTGLVAAGCSSQPEPTCTDGARNGEESDVDCGGLCGPCAEGQGCNAPADCESQMCAGDVCVTPFCGDGVINQESEECDDANADDSDDCTSICELADCADAIRNADEIDVDCGGHCGPASCAPGQMCTGEGDCTSGACVGGTCESAGATIVIGAAHTCRLTAAGAVHCWGQNDDGQLGYGHTSHIGDDELPSVAGPVDVGGTVAQLVAGAHHTCALLDDGAVRCWGRNDYGQLGYGHTQNIGNDEIPSVADPVDVGGTVVQLAAGALHTCALLDTGALRCWGRNLYGQLGYGHTFIVGAFDLPSEAGDVGLGGTAVQVIAGGYHTCALLDTGALRCWGQNYYGQLGYGHAQLIGDNELPSTAGDIDLGGTVVQATAGGYHTCALLEDGAVHCWGYNVYGQLGYGHISDIGDDELPSSAGPVSLGGTATHLLGSLYHTCALLDKGAVRCWGYNVSGQLGYGHISDIGDDELPSSAGDASVGGVVAQMSLGHGYHTCALLDTRAVRCWGNNGYGQLGYGHTSNIGDDELPPAAGDVPYQ